MIDGNKFCSNSQPKLAHVSINSDTVIVKYQSDQGAQQSNRYETRGFNIYFESKFELFLVIYFLIDFIY